MQLDIFVAHGLDVPTLMHVAILSRVFNEGGARYAPRAIVFYSFA